MARDYEAEYKRRQKNLASRLGIPEFQVRQGPLLRTLARGHTPKYFSELSPAEQQNVYDYIADHPRTPVGRDNIKKVAKGEGRLSDLRRPWRNPQNIRPMMNYVLQVKRAAQAAVDGLFNSQAEIDLRAKRKDGPDELFVGWGSFLVSGAEQPSGSRRRRPRPLEPEKAAREALALTYSVPEAYVMMQIVPPEGDKPPLLQLYTD